MLMVKIAFEYEHQEIIHILEMFSLPKEQYMTFAAELVYFK